MKHRSHNEGSIYWDKGKNLWVAKISLPDGKRKVKYSKSQKAVKEWLVTAQNQLRQGLLPKDDSITVSQYIDNYMENVGKHNLRPKTIEVYSYLIRLHIVPVIGHIKLTQLRPDHLQALYSQKLESGLSKRTVQFIHSVIHKSLHQALKWGMVARNVAELVEAPRPKRNPPILWNPDQMNLFLNHAEKNKYYMIFLLATYCGFREGEVLGIHVEDCDLDRGTINVTHTVQTLKGGLVITEPKTESSRRAVTVPKTALIALKKYIRAMNKKEGLVFTTSTGGPISPSNVVKAFKAETKEAGLPKIRFHDLRHFHASALLLAGVSPKVIQERLGHSQINTTLDIYAHVMPSMHDDAAEKMNKILAQK